ncbi:universal stress protein [Devosia sp. RR2S18]|jgi:nucleotide-binding universal stress UspA family protein|uniref:universal stress protein n=1 Tax=Devosia rhizosphaerae TaxID=3049774 RepID=UPI00253FF8D4|nr:universal stress protein [Devosia sp. RR2S18]WIJ24074.1 universal stress protein [Devosia sp. RR2S18]
MPKLIAFVDGSVYSESVLDHAAWVATTIGASVDVVHVIGRRDVSSAPVDLSGNLEAGAHSALLNDLAAHDEQRAKLARDRGRLIVDTARSRLLTAGVGEVHAKLRMGDIVDAVHELEADADLVLIGKRGEAADFAKLHLGSNLERVARTSRKPVLVASRAFKPVNRFLIAFDGGESIMKAVNHIAAGTLFPGLACTMIMVGKETPENRGKLESSAGTLRNAGYAVDALIEPGEPDKVIAAHAEADHIDLLVMGAYGHSRVRSFIIGSTTTEMIRSVRIPVMLFR